MRGVALAAALVVALASFPAAAAAAPTPVTAWYVYGSTASGLQSYAYARGCDFAQSQPGNGLRVLLLDFGAARKLSSSTWGAIDFSNTTVANGRSACRSAWRRMIRASVTPRARAAFANGCASASLREPRR